MEAVDNTIEKATWGLRRSGHWHWIVTLVFLLGASSVALLIWTEQIRQRQRIHFAYANGLEDFRIMIATAHVWIEEATHGVNGAEFKRALGDLRAAQRLAELLINGGLSQQGLMLQPLMDPELRRRGEDLKRLVSELATITQDLIRQPEVTAAASVLERTHDDIFNKIQQSADELEEIIEKNATADDAKSGRLIYWILLAWSFLVVTSTAAVFGWERTRKQVEKTLQQANDELETRIAERTEELRALTGLLEARSNGLRTANIALEKEVLERKEAEGALRGSEEQYRRLVETMNEGLMVVDHDQILTYVNDKFCEMLGYSRDELLGRRSSEFFSAVDRQKLTGHMGANSHYNHNHDDAKKLRYEVSFNKKDGGKVFTIVSPRAICDENHNSAGCFAVITDITEKVALQVETMRTAHLLSLGEVAAGVAHEINNPINAIINYAWILLRRGQEGEAHEIPNGILKQARRIADIVRDLLLFARGGKKDKQLVHVSEILADSLRLMESEMRHDGIQIMIAMPADLPEITADPQEIQQVFMNMISNARFALNQKYPESNEEKRLHINAQRLAIDQSTYVRIAFHDRGVGVPASIIDKVREPFFSTKPKGKGTGLGLSISDGIIRNHGGNLVIESVEGEFTNVIVNLPVGEFDNGKHSCH